MYQSNNEGYLTLVVVVFILEYRIVTRIIFFLKIKRDKSYIEISTFLN